ncbi:hypothetical protein WR25_16813 isoform B [Diploscapter pachys]|uniref:Uncharacterized protein n=1 Tax=Diploscapter pachys TaxID=2018661 RepID=A0A2A2K739_9BILA|nr:hypothetical protein WR25_16813 isoform B [Diploscapter pachys]
MTTIRHGEHVQPRSKMIKLSDSNVKSLVMAKSIKENTMRINSVNFSNDGMHMITSSDDDSIFLFDMQSGQKKKNVNSKKYGVSLIRFSHNISNAVHCSTKVDDTIRYLSLHDNKYLRYFPGHSKKVVCLCMSPVDDVFLSSSLDKTIRLWDLRSQNCQGLMSVGAKPVAAFDPEGLIFAAGVTNKEIKLYDLRSFDKGPFATFKVVDDYPHCTWSSLVFSPCGKTIMINTNGECIKLIDAFNGNLKYNLVGHENDAHEELEASFTPDGQFVFVGSSSGKIYGYSVETGMSKL